MFPALVTEDGDGFKRVSYEHIPMLLLQGIKELKAENDALKALVCADHPEAEICQGATTYGGIDILPGPEQARGLALWVFGSIGAVIAGLGAVFLFTSRRRSETAA